MKKLRLRAPVTIATLFSLLVLAVALGVLERGIRSQTAAWQWVVHTREVLENVQAVLTLTSEAEAAQRGFLIARNEVFVASYRQARDSALPQVAELRVLTRDNPRQQAALQRFEEALRMRLALLDRVMQAGLAGRAPDLALLESGNALKQQIQAQAALIRAEERRLLQERQQRVADARRELITAFAITAAVAAFLVLLLWIISSRDAARLLAERARLDATLRSIGDGVIATDPQGRVSLMNRVAEELTGTPEARGTGMRLEQLLRFRDRTSGSPVALGEALGDGGEHLVLASGNGREYATELSAAPIEPDTGAAAGTVLVLRDVTERNARARALAESEANYRYTIELNPQIPWRASPDGAMERFSDRWLSLTGQARDAVAGAGWASVILDEDEPATVQAWTGAVASGEPFDAEFRIHAAGGEVRWMRSRANPRRDDSGAIVAWYGLTEDIDARKQSELALAARLAQIETIYRAVPVGLGLIDAGMRLTELNDALADVGGVPKPAIVGRSPAEVLPAPLGERFGMMLEQVMGTQRPVTGVEFSRTGTAALPQRDWLASCYPVLEDGKLQGVVIALLEVTQIKAAQRELIEANQMLEQRVEERTAQIAEANAELRAFAHTVAHDLRAPLRNVEGFATALIEDEGARMSEDGRMFAERIVAAVVRMDRLITDLLAYSRLSRAELRLERVDLGMVVRTVLRDLEAQIGETGAQVDIAGPLPAVLGNATILVQVIANLVSNAVKFVDKGVVPRMSISGSRDGKVARLAIGDNGIGIVPEHREHVFGVFERLHGHERYPGTGIGLAIVKKGLERMDGTVRILDREGGGTTFELSMQAAD